MSKIFAVVAVALLFLSGALAVGYAAEDGGERFDRNNESFDAEPAGNETVLDGSNIDGATYTRTVTVYNNSDVLMVKGEDYRWNESNGTLIAISGGGLDDNNAGGRINYSYRIPTDQQSDIASMYGGFYQASAPLVFVLMVGVILGALIKLGS